MPEKIQAIQQFKKPVTNKGLQEFLGMIIFYNRFLPSAAHIMKPLYAAIAGHTKKIQDILWTDKMLQAFSRTKDALAKAVLLVHPHHHAPTRVVTDASDVAVGAALEQHINGCWCPLAFFSKQLSSAQQKYSAFDRELLAGAPCL